MIVVRRRTVLADRSACHESALVRVGAVEGPSVVSGVAISLLAVALVVVLMVV